MGTDTPDGFSDVFRIVVNPEGVNDNQSLHGNKKNTFDINARRNVDSATSSLNNKVTNFLKDEQNRMEERIRTFTEQEHARFAALQSRVNQEKNSLINRSKLVDIHDRQKVEQYSSDLKSENHHMIDLGLILGDRPPNQTRTSEPAISNVPSGGNAYESPVKSPPTKLRPFNRPKPEPIDDMFPMDDETQKVLVPFESSDSDELEADDSPPVRHRYISNRQYAASVPISVPHWIPENHAKDDEDDHQVYC